MYISSSPLQPSSSISATMAILSSSSPNTATRSSSPLQPGRYMQSSLYRRSEGVRWGGVASPTWSTKDLQPKTSWPELGLDYFDKLDETFIFFYKYLPIFHEDSSTYQTNSHQQEYAEKDFQIEKKSLFTHQGSLNSIARLAVLLDNLLSVGQFGLIAYGENFQKYPK